MIIRPRENWFKMLFIWKGSVLSHIIPQLLLVLIFSILVTWLHGAFFSYKIPLSPVVFTLLGVALAIFLGFCNTASYDRFWEGRKLWGALIIDSRSLVRQAKAYLPRSVHEEFTQLVIAFSYALKHQLRGTMAEEDLVRLLPKQLAGKVSDRHFKPVSVLDEISLLLKGQLDKGEIDSIVLMGIDNNVNKLSEILGGCERINNTPIPFSYHVLLHRTVYLYCFLLPFGLVDAVGWMTPIMVTFIAYTFIALDAIIDEISEPFGTEPNDLALDAMCHTIEHSLNEQIGRAYTVNMVNKKYYYQT
ncbi:bestrophin family protein [Olivibacter sitiensis]|uniref:bestrophin family protein n=1 Tax=Olivibacter sitiensis TaxID=376470 RepID=UPI000411C328|nr:bestrophin family ion channel [Olivibacter sitiensis]